MSKYDKNGIFTTIPTFKLKYIAITLYRTRQQRHKRKMYPNNYRISCRRQDTTHNKPHGWKINHNTQGIIDTVAMKNTGMVRHSGR